MKYIEPGLVFKYSNHIEMSNDERIKLYSVILSNYEVSPDEIEKEFGINVGQQILKSTAGVSSTGTGVPISDEEYLKRYGRPRTVNNKIAEYLIAKK